MLPTLCRVYIFEDQFFDMQAIKGILGKIPEIQIVGEGATMREALESCRQKNPNLIIADASIYDDNTTGPAFVKNVRKELPDVRILGLTRHPEMVETLKHAGCDFVANKNMIENHSIALSYIRETLLPRVPYATPLKPPRLTPEEDRILRLIADGMTEQQIAATMSGSSRRPVRRIKESLFNKFGAVSVAQLVNLAYKTGYLKPDED